MKNLILIGGGGHCKSCIDIIESSAAYKIIGILDVEEKIGENILGYPVIGTDDLIEEYNSKQTAFCISIGQIKAGIGFREKVFKKLDLMKAEIPVIISESAVVSRFSEIKRGTAILSLAMINAGAVIEENCIINTKALIEHDAYIGRNCHISTSAVINGNCSVGDNCMISTGAVLKNGITVVAGYRIGMGAIVTKDITVPGTYFGNPARKIDK